MSIINDDEAHKNILKAEFASKAAKTIERRIKNALDGMTVVLDEGTFNIQKMMDISVKAEGDKIFIYRGEVLFDTGTVVLANGKLTINFDCEKKDIN